MNTSSPSKPNDVESPRTPKGERDELAREGKPITTKAYHPVLIETSDQNAPQQVYVSALAVEENPILRRQVLEQARGELARWRDDWRFYQTEFQGVFSAIDETIGESA